ncbi:MAG: hypothetical protein HIU92_13510 [Proteobacteria bacterium]|nr:hypothetical protein [Pseudomonadota bacterium]
MTEETPSAPRLTPAAAKAKAAREERQAAALRANLRRRKEQARERQPEPPKAPGADRDAAPAHSMFQDISEPL